MAKAVRGAVGEVRKNVHHLQSGNTTPSKSSTPPPPRAHQSASELAAKIQILEDRNRALANMLEGALGSLRSHDKALEEHKDEKKNLSSDDLAIAMAKVQFVQVYLEDPTIPIPLETSPPKQPSVASDLAEKSASSSSAKPEPTNSVPGSSNTGDSDEKENASPIKAPTRTKKPPFKPEALKPQESRPSLAQSSFSWMLGEEPAKSSFVNASPFPPDQRRESIAKDKHGDLFGEGGAGGGKRPPHGVEKADDGFTLESLQRK